MNKTEKPAAKVAQEPRQADAPVVPLKCDRLAAADGVAHAFFTRKGGVSKGVHASLNAGLGSEDERAAIAENRRRMAAYFGVSADRLLTAYQVHSADALLVDEAWAPVAERPRCDALVTRTPGLLLGVLTADCAPVLFADPAAGVVAVAHAGWRGALSGVTDTTLDVMEKAGANRNEITATVGPCISAVNYEVGDEFRTTFLRTDPTAEEFFSLPTPESRPHFDLPGYVAARLTRAGVGRIGRNTPCTYAQESLFYSYRRATHCKHADYGRQISAILLK